MCIIRYNLANIKRENKQWRGYLAKYQPNKCIVVILTHHDEQSIESGASMPECMYMIKAGTPLFALLSGQIQLYHMHYGDYFIHKFMGACCDIHITKPACLDSIRLFIPAGEDVSDLCYKAIAVLQQKLAFVKEDQVATYLRKMSW